MIKVGNFVRISFTPVTNFSKRYSLRIVQKFSSTGSPIFYFVDHVDSILFLEKDYLLVKIYTYYYGEHSFIFINENGNIIEIKADSFEDDFRICSAPLFKYEKLLTHEEEVVRNLIRQFLLHQGEK